MIKKNSLVAEMKAAFNKKAGKEQAKSFSKDDTLMQIQSWVKLKPFFKDATGGEGFPCGHVTQIIGKPDSGKTTLMMEGMVECQRQGGVVWLIDSEHKFSLQRFDLMGGDSSELVIIQVDNLEDAWDSMHKVCQTVSEYREKGVQEPMMMCWDSIAATVPKRIMESEAGDAHVAVEAKLNNKNVRKLRAQIKETELCCVFINHYYMTQPKTMYDRSELVIKGGEELTFLSTLVLKTVQGAKIERGVLGEKQKLGRTTRFEVHKGHFHGRTIVKDVYVVDKGILETDEQLEEYKKGLKGAI
jgi:RecA/RadA recombinase